MTTGPRLARWMLGRLLPASVRADVLGELDREYRLQLGERGARDAGRWYRRQALASTAPALAMRSRLTAVLVEQCLRDIRIGIRRLLRRPGFTATVVLTCALGIGVTTAALAVADTVLLKPLPFPRPDELVRVWSRNPKGIPKNSASLADFHDWREASRPFATLAAFSMGTAMTLRASPAERVSVSTVTPAFFAVLERPAAIGRTLLPEDAAPNAGPTVVLSDAGWRRLFGASTAVLGAPVTLDGVERVVVGVMPPDFRFPEASVDFWLLVPAGSENRGPRNARFIEVIGRLAPGATVDQARRSLEITAARMADTYATNLGWGITMASLYESIVGDVRRPLLLACGAVLSVLLIACVNVANLLLMRGAGRLREVRVECALGASRARVLREHLAESAVVGVASGAAGVALAVVLLGLVRAGIGVGLPRIESLALDARAVLAAVLVTLVTIVIAGLWPALRMSRLGSGPIVEGDSRSVASAERSHGALLSAEVALALPLFVTAGLLMTTFVRLQAVDPGFSGGDVLLADVSLTAQPASQWTPMLDRVVEQARVLPGVTAVAAVTPLPLSGQTGLLRFGLAIEGRQVTATGTIDRIYLRWVTPAYFETMGIRLIAGRDFRVGDTAAAEPVAIVDESFVRRHFPNDNPIGKRVRPSNMPDWRTIIGVVGAVHQTSLESGAEPHLYVSNTQIPSPVMTLIVRTSTDPALVIRPLRAAMNAVDPASPLFKIRTLNAVLDGAVAPKRANAVAVGAFGLLAALLTAIGIYGVMAQWVNASSRELGIRMALGASRRDVFALVMRRVMRLSAAGLAAGLALAFVAARLVSGLLFGVRAAEPAIFTAAVLFIVGTVWAAAFIPAHRAQRIDPHESLRT